VEVRVGVFVGVVVGVDVVVDVGVVVCVGVGVFVGVEVTRGVGLQRLPHCSCSAIVASTPDEVKTVPCRAQMYINSLVTILKVVTKPAHCVY
jgi:hypothetical protein